MKKKIITLIILAVSITACGTTETVDSRSRFQSGSDYRSYVNQPERLSIEELEELEINLGLYKDSMYNKHGEKYEGMGDYYQVLQTEKNILILKKLRQEGM